MATLPQCTTGTINFHGWEAYFLANDLIRLVAVPDIGGRIMAYDLGPYPYLYVEPALAGKLFTPAENAGRWFSGRMEELRGG